ncbi:DUF1983 domain-containing protein [Pseudomonas sp. NPDC089428]|uniref:phage tail tip fiber protein n=1 Tax=Pseudomonas sp. NPDC089428 TaxID=3364467 RepID=UPI0038175987
MSNGVRKIAQVAVGAVIGFVQGGPVGAAIGAGLAFYMAEQQEKLNTKSPMRDNEPSAQTVRSSKAPARFILGRVSTGGVLVWAQEQVGDQTDGEWLHLVYVLCEGPVDALENIYLGEEEIATYGEHASYELVVNPTQVNAFLTANCPDWKEEQIGRGLSFVRLSLKYSAEKFPSGIPDARFIVRGRNDIYDPRSGIAVYTENTALHILWFLRNRCGVPDDEIVFETFASGANICDESVANPDNTTSPRYRSSCVIGADEQRTNVLQKLEAACGGRTIRVGGRWMFQAGAYYGPYDFEITEDMVIGTITGSTEPTNDAAINTVRGTFIDTSQSWTETDYPEVSVAEWVVEDGGEAAETLTFSYVTDAYQAQRLANIELRRRRAGGTISIPMNFLGYNCRPGRAVRVNLPSLNILGEFIVTNWSMGADQGCTAQLQQYDAAQFDDAVGQPYNPIGFISLPAGGLGSPTGLAWTVDESAEINQGVLSWVQPAGIVTAYAVTVRQGTTAVQAQQVPATTLQLPLSGLPSGNYTMSVAALGPLTRSGEASITVNIDGPPIPESCVVQATIDTITLIPGNALHGLNGGTYEYFFSTNPQAAQGDYLGQGLTLTHTGLAFATNYAYFVRSKNAYGVSAFLKVVASTSTDVSNMLDALKDKIENGQLAPAMKEKIALIDGPPSLPGSVNDRLQQLDDQVREVTDNLQEQIEGIADLADSMPYDPDTAYVLGQAVLGDDGKLYQAKQAVPAGSPPPNTTYWTDIGQAVQTANGLAARVTTVETAVTDQDGKLTAQSQRIDGVQSSLTITNQNVTAAQQAAQDAATLAGGKGKVIVQSAAPAAADRLAQNLWIDTTGNANTPKRWNGTAWVAVTDKVATDAAAAAANALSVAQTKADASVVDSLSSTVTQQGNTITSQGQSITGLSNSLTTTNQNVTAAQQAAQAAADAAGAKGKVLYQSTAPAVADRLTQNLWIDTTGSANTPKRWNGTAWVAVTDKVATDAAAAAASALTQVASKADASTVSALSNTVTQQGQTITAQGSDITNIKASVSNVSGENLLLDPLFASSNGLTSIPAAVALPRNDATVPAGASTAKVVKVTTATATGNTYYGFSAALNQRPPENTNASQIAVAAGEVYDFELYVYVTAARGQTGLWIQFYDGAGASVGHNWAVQAGDGVRLTSTTGAWVKLTGQATVPAACIRMAMTFRVGPGDATDVFMSGPVARKRAGQDNAQATALQAVDARVTTAEGSIISQGSALTQLSNTVAGKADNSALQSLQSTVTLQGNTLTTQGQAVTQLQSTIGGIGGSGSNLLADDYSWLTSTTLPATSVGSGVTREGVAVAEADSGFGYQAGSSTNSFLMLTPTNNLAGWNVRIEPGVYLVSMYMQASAATNGRISLYNGTHRYSPTVALPTTRTRVMFPVTVTDSAKVGITIYFNMSAVSGLTCIIDSVMIEKRVGESNTPSPFVAGPSARAVSGQATAISQLNTTVTQQGTAITAQAERVDGLYVQVNPEMEGDSTGLAGATGSFVGVWTEQSARVEDGIATGRRIDTVQSTVGDVSASVQQVSETVAGVDGRVSAMTTIKAETISGGRRVMAGLALGSDGETAEILAYAQRFAIVDQSSGQVTLPFVVSNGQVFINQAVINAAFIQNLILGMTLKSQAVNSQGLPLLELNFVTGAVSIRGQDANGSTLLNNGGVYVYDANGIERTAVGRLT